MPPSQTTPTVAPARLEHPAATLPPPVPPHAPGPILVADDGSEAATSALAVAKLLAGSPDELQVVSVVEPMPMTMGPDELPVYSVEVDDARARLRHERLRPQVAALFAEWTPAIDVVVGHPIEALSRVARQRRARLLVAGLRHHGRLDRMMLHRETPLGVADAARTPVLIVPEGTTHLPRTVIVAADLDEASVSAARHARPLLAGAEKVYVVHVRGVAAPSTEHDERREQRLSEMTQRAYERVVAALDLPPQVSIELRTITGHPVDELLDFAEYARVELIVAGHHRRRLLGRLSGARSVAERVFRGATCMMLLVPDVSALELAPDAEAEVEVHGDRMAWQLPLVAFTYRNVGRPAHLVIETIGAGVRARLEDAPFLAADYDEAGETLRLTFGGSETRGPRIVHTIPGADALEIQRPRDGEDLALRVAHEDGYSLLTFRDSGEESR